ncbi:MAG: envelope stress response membrane protein PspC [Nitrospiraceae bacterium]|nr:envelope stress response membrane protein PspC [Nitrospiraceae bacterium]
MNDYYEDTHRSLYRSRRGILFGVCRGIGEYTNFSVFWIRVIVVAATFFSGLWPVPAAYFLAALLMKLEPVAKIHNDEEREFYSSFTASRAMALQRVKRAFDRLDRRVQRMESIVTSKEYDWERRLNS